MTDTTFSTKLNWFAAESDTVEVECQECGKRFEVDKHTAWGAKYCSECYAERERNRARAIAKNKQDITGDPVTNLVYAVCRQAVIDSDNGDRDAKQWLVTDMELWLKACGLDLRPSERMRIRRIV